MEYIVDREDLYRALFSGEVDALTYLLEGELWPDHALQLVGEAVLVVTHAAGRDVESAARRCVRELRDRDWEGDAELATQIEAASGWATTPLLRSVPVCLEEVADLLEGDPQSGGGRIELRTGEVWPQFVLDDMVDPDDDDEGERWLWVGYEGSGSGYHDMELFIDLVEDQKLADRLVRALHGRGPFRRFKDALADTPGLLQHWFGFTDDRKRGRARAWLAEEGYVPAPAGIEPFDATGG